MSIIKDDVYQYESYPSGLKIKLKNGIILDFDIQLLGQMFTEWHEKNPNIAFLSYVDQSEEYVKSRKTTMPEWFCPKCKIVYQSKIGKHCKIDSEIFSSENQNQINALISGSNGWRDVWEKWENNSILKNISSQLANEGHYGASTAINVFIQKLLDKR